MNGKMKCSNLRSSILNLTASPGNSRPTLIEKGDQLAEIMKQYYLWYLSLAKPPRLSSQSREIESAALVWVNRGASCRVI